MNKGAVEGLELFKQFIEGSNCSLETDKDGKFVDDVTLACWLGWLAGRKTMYNQVTSRMI